MAQPANCGTQKRRDFLHPEKLESLSEFDGVSVGFNQVQLFSGSNVGISSRQVEQKAADSLLGCRVVLRPTSRNPVKFPEDPA